MAEPEKTITLNAEEFERVYEIAVQKGMRKFTPGEARALESVRRQADEQLAPEPDEADELFENPVISALGDVGEILVESGFENLKQIEEASDDELLAVKGIGPKALEQIRGYPEGGGDDGN